MTTTNKKHWSDNYPLTQIIIKKALANIILIPIALASIVTGYDISKAKLDSSSEIDELYLSEHTSQKDNSSEYPRVSAAGTTIGLLISLPFKLTFACIAIACATISLSFSAISTIYSGAKRLFSSKAPNGSNSEVPSAENVTSPYNELEEEEEEKFTLADKKSPTMTTAFHSTQQQSNDAGTNYPSCSDLLEEKEDMPRSPSSSSLSAHYMV